MAMANVATPLRRSARIRQSRGYLQAQTPTQPAQTPAADHPATRNGSNTDATEAGAASPPRVPEPEDTIATTAITPFKRLSQLANNSSVDETSTPTMARTAQTKIPTKTPDTSEKRFRPALEEMHPSKVQHSTTKSVDPGMVLGFKPIPKSPANQLATSTPSKSRLRQADSAQMDSPNYSILRTPTREQIQLSEEARQLMETIRKDAAKIEAEMVKERAKQRAERADGDAERATPVRKLATPMRPSGRFSNAHIAQFKKMDSIENHPSSYRPLLPLVVSQSTKKTLKRTMSAATLDETTPSQQHTAPKRQHLNDTPITQPSSDNKVTQQTSSRDAETPVTPTRKSAIPKASTVYHARVTKPPSPVADKQAAPRTPQTEFNPKFKTQIPELKSILRKRQPLFSTNPDKIAAGTHIPPPPGVTTSQNWDQKLYGLSNESSTPAPSPSKRVAFSPSAKRSSTTRLREAIDKASPTRRKIAVDGSSTPSQADEHATPPSYGVVRYPSLPPTTPSPASTSKTASIRRIGDSSAVPSPKSPSIRAPAAKTHQQPPKASPMPTVSSASKLPLTERTPGSWPEMIPHGLSNKKRHRDQIDDGEGNEENTPPTEGAAKGERMVKEKVIKRLKVSKEPTIKFTSGTKSDTNGNAGAKGIRTFTANKNAAPAAAVRSTATAGTASSAAKSAAAAPPGPKVVPHTPASKRIRPGAQPRTTASTRHVTPAARRGAAAFGANGKRQPASATAARRAGNASGGISMSRLAALAQPKKR